MIVNILFRSDILQVQIQYGFKINSSSYSIHKIFRMELNMISSLKRQGLYEVSIGLGKEYYEYEN